MTLILIFGALSGLGIFLLFSLLDRSPGSGPSALARLDLDRTRYRRERALSAERGYQGEARWMRVLGGQLRQAVEARGWQLPRPLITDLNMVNRSVETHLAMSVVGGVLGFVGIVLLGGILSLFGLGFSGAPFGLAIVALALGALVPSLTVRDKAANLRRDMRHVVGSFLDLVAMNLSGGRGVPEALDAASGISNAWGLVLIRDALINARLQGQTPWAALGGLGDRLGIDELRDLSAALTLVAEDGAKVKESLFARADAMRTRELSEMEGQAQARSQSMLVAQLLLAVGFLVFLIYPAIARVAAGL